jgi:hypothetical protein
MWIRMYIELSDLLLVSIVLAGCAFWWSSLKHRDFALKTARQSCDKMGLQLLDQSVGLQKLRFKRDDDGQMRLFRRYGFEFSSTGDERYYGEIEMLGRRITRVFHEPHRVS